MNGETYDMKEAAERIGIKGIGRNKLISLLRECRVLDDNRMPYARYMENGYFKLHTSVFIHETRGEMARNKTLVTPRGIEFITALLNDYLDKSKPQQRTGTHG